LEEEEERKKEYPRRKIEVDQREEEGVKRDIEGRYYDIRKERTDHNPFSDRFRSCCYSPFAYYYVRSSSWSSLREQQNHHHKLLLILIYTYAQRVSIPSILPLALSITISTVTTITRERTNLLRRHNQRLRLMRRIHRHHRLLPI